MDDNNHTMPVDTGKTSAYMASLLPSYFITKQFFNGPCSLQIFDHQKYETAPCPTSWGSPAQHFCLPGFIVSNILRHKKIPAKAEILRSE